MPIAYALATGCRATYRSGMVSRSSVSAQSTRSRLTLGYCFSLTRIAEASVNSRSARSFHIPATAFNTDDTPGTARSVAIAARSAGCS
jgi:hypothetical protein